MLKLIVFDFDGTLVDTLPLAFEQFQLTFKNFNLTPPTFEKLKPFYGLKIVDIMAGLLPNHTSGQIEEMLVYWKSVSPKFAAKTKLLPGVLEALNKLYQKYHLAIFTNRTKVTLEIILRNHQLDQHFKTLIGLEHVKNHKPHPEGLLKILKDLKLKRTEAIYIGDTQSDILAARAAGIKAVLIHPDKNHGLDPDYHILSVRDLEKLLTTI